MIDKVRNVVKEKDPQALQTLAEDIMSMMTMETVCPVIYTLPFIMNTGIFFFFLIYNFPSEVVVYCPTMNRF